MKLKPTNLTNVKFKAYELNTGDDRTCGTLTLNWDTDKGVLTYKLAYDGSGDPANETWSLNGEELKDSQWQEVSNFVLDEAQPPHHYAGPKAEKLWRKHFTGVDLTSVLDDLRK